MIDVCVAVVRLCSKAIDRLENDKFKQRQQQVPPFGPANFDLLMALPSTIGTSKLKKTLALPKCKALHAETGGEAALRFVKGLCRSLRVRVVSVPMANLDHSLPGCSSSTSHFDRPDSPQLILIPITPSEVSSDRVGETLEFCPLASLMHASMNFDSDFVDVRSQNFVMRIGEWLMHRQCQADFGSTSFLNALFLIPPASQRIFHCVHNPSYDPRQLRFCCQSSAAEDKENGPRGKRVPSELDEAVKRSNALRAEMLRMEKYDKFVINPLFGANILCKRQITAPAYFARNHSSRATGRHGSGGKGAIGTAKKRVQQQRSPTEFWEQQYPLHKHAFDGNADRIRELLAHGNDPNEQDNDLWTPLHYCAFYNRLEASEALLLHPRTNVNVVNGTGATPLHFAALNGNIYVAELILSHQLADINIRDSTGKTPLDLCVLVPKPDWQGVAFLLKQSVPAQLAKMEVQLIGAPSLQVEVDDAEMVTAEELRAKVLQMEGLDPDLGARIFAIWLIDSRLSLQLKAEQNVKVHLDKWAEHLEKFGDDCVVGGSGGGEGEERARVVLKRDARTLLGDEQMLARKSAATTSLLYGEAEAQFLQGMYPCHEKHFVPMAAIVAYRLYGAEWPSEVNAALLSHILPCHFVPSGASITSLVSKLRHAHRSLAGRSPVQLQLHFLSLCWSLNVYGCTFFRAFLLMSKPLRGNLQIHLGLNDWGICMINASTHKQMAAIEMDKLDVKFTPNTNFLEVATRRKDLIATITTSQAVLINNLLKQLKLKVQQANRDRAVRGGSHRH